MNDGARTTTFVPGVRLPRNRPSEFDPVEIVYTRYTIDRTRPEGDQVVARPRSHVVRNTTIEDFIDGRANGRPLPPADDTYHQAPDDSGQERPIDIFVSEQCWVVIELDEREKWQFVPGSPGITTRDDHKSDNWGLTHVMHGGTLADGEGPTGDRCKIIYFGVNARCKNERQRFICNIDFSQLRLRDEQVDPDIPNDGGKFPFPLHGKPCPEDDA